MKYVAAHAIIARRIYVTPSSRRVGGDRTPQGCIGYTSTSTTVYRPFKNSSCSLRAASYRIICREH
eukprot:5691288-Pleurochrysis_carterae.AAC.1